MVWSKSRNDAVHFKYLNYKLFVLRGRTEGCHSRLPLCR